MKELSFERMELINGGDWVDWADGACAIFTVVTWKSVLIGTTLPGAIAFCAGYGVGRWLGSL